MALQPLYNFASWIVSTVLTPLEARKRPPERRDRWRREKWVRVTPPRCDLWVHGVSVGEALVAGTLIRELKRRRSGLRVALSTVTDTGQDIAAKNGSQDELFYLPWDVENLHCRLLEGLRPRAILTMETELWPGLVAAASRMGIPFVILNGRISDRSFRGYRWIDWFMRGTLRRISYFGMQTPEDQHRVRALGATGERTGITGNLKYDLEAPQGKVPTWMKRLQRPVFVAGSTHEGEEDEILKAFSNRLGGGTPGTILLAPRHPERFERVAETVRRHGWKTVLRSELENSDGDGDVSGVVVLDRMGELAGAYGGADVVFVGGSLVPVGGHNILEVAAWEKPVLFGPRMENFRQISQDFLKSSAGIQVENGRELARVTAELVEDPRLCNVLGRRARALLDRNRGTVERCADLVENLLDGRPAGGS